MAYNCVVEGTKPSSFVGLLDLYPNAEAAYSLRKLKADYTGDAIKVRKTVAGVTTNQDIGFDSNGDLDTASLLSFVGAGNDGFVHTWYDQSGNGNDVTQNSGSLQVRIVNNGVVDTKNNKPALVKTTGDSRFERAALSIYDSFGFSNFSVHTNDQSSTGGIILSTSIVETVGLRILADTRTKKRNFVLTQVGNPTVLSDLSKQYFQGEQVLLSSFCDNSGNISGFDNSNIGGTDTILSGFTNNKFYIGGHTSVNFIGSFQEFVVYPDSQLPNRLEIETNINNYYNVY